MKYLVFLTTPLLLMIFNIHLHAQGNKAAVSRNATDTQTGKAPAKTKQASKPVLPDSLLHRKGKKLFTELCSVCYSRTKEIVVGPGLADVTKRRSFVQLSNWIRNSMKMILSGDKYANELFNRWNRAPMPGFASLSDEDIRSILFYIDGNYPEKK